MDKLYTREDFEAEQLIDYLKENKEKFSGLAIYDTNSTEEHPLVTIVVGPPLPLATYKENIFSSIIITIAKSKTPVNNLEICVGPGTTGHPDYELYEYFIKYAYENLVNENMRKAIVTPSYVLVPYGPDFEEFKDYSTHPSYLVYER